MILIAKYFHSVRRQINTQVSRKMNNQKGMTLIEIMIVLVIVGGMAAILGSQIFSRFKTAKVRQAKLQMSEVTKALDVFYADCNSYPDSSQGLNALVTAPANCKNWGPEPYVKPSLLKDPWGSDFIYENEGSSYTIRSLGGDKKEGGSGADADISSADL